MTEYDLGKVVGEDGAKGDKGDKGDTGATGNGIQSIVLRSTVGKVKTYRITFTNGDTFDFQVTDGEDGSSSEVEIVTSWNNTLSDEKVPSEKLSKNTLDGKAPTSHASSANTYGLGSTSNYGHVKTINGLTQSSHSNGTALSAYQGKVLKDAIDAKPDSSDIPTKTSDLTNDGADGTNVFIANNDSRLSDARTPTSHTHTKSQITDFPSLASVATSGSYEDLSDKPTIPTVPTNVSAFTNDAGYLTSHQDISGKVNTSDIANNLTTTTSGKVLDARQGKVLADLIGDAITYINQ